MTRTRALALLSALSAGALLLAGSLAASASTAVIVRPSQPNGWTVGGSGVIATGAPAGGLGTGAVRVESEVATTGRGFVRTDVAPIAGTRLADLDRVDYRVAVTAYPPAAQFLTGYVVLFLALDGNPANGGDASPGQPNLVAVIYEPCYAQPANCSGTIQPLDSWHTWSATPTSPAWWNADAIGGHPPATVYSTLGTVVLNAYPAAVVTAMKVQVGQGGAGAPWQGWHGWLDGVRFVAGGASPVDELVDFEPDLPALPGPPTQVSTSVSGSAVTLHWAPPTTGGTPVTGYVVTVAGVAHALAASARSYTVQGVAAGGTVAFTVAAVNAAGTGPGVTAQATVPAPPPTPTPSASGGMPATGVDPRTPALAAASLGLLTTGCALTLAATAIRRRSSARRTAPSRRTPRRCG